MMLFGDPLQPTDTTASTSWIDDACHGEWWTVGARVPSHDGGILQPTPKSNEPETSNANGCATTTVAETQPSAASSLGFDGSNGRGATCYLVTGAVSAVTDLRQPDSSDWRNPDLFWPDDRRWFVATDVDFWSLSTLAGRSTSPTRSPTPHQLRSGTVRWCRQLNDLSG
jgi:hypothetical protein